MTLLDTTSSSSDNSNKRCPYLGLREDSDTALGFPSEWNFCHRAKPVAIPNQEHQQNFCLTTQHVNCPVFSTEKKSSLPKDLRIPKWSGQRRIVSPWVAVGLVLFFVIASGLILSEYWAPSWAENLLVSEWISEVKPKEIATGTSVPVVETDTFAINATPEIQIEPTEEVASATETEAVLTCAYPLEKPIGTNGQFLVHQVDHGENMAMLAERYQTTASAIDVANYFLPSPLWAELVIVIPVGNTEIGDLLSLKPVFVDEDDTSLVKLAENLSVSLSDLQELNQLSPFCQSFHGWILIPAEKKKP